MDTRITADWLQKALKFSDMSQAELARRLSERLGKSVDRAAINKLAKGGRRLMLDEMLAISKITSFKPLNTEHFDDPQHLQSEEVLAPAEPDHVASVFDGGRAGIPEGEIPQVDARLGMGHAEDAQTIQIPAGDHDIAAVPVLDTWKIPKNVLQRRLRGAVSSLHIVECEGDSMDPRIRNGDFVFIDTSRRVPSPPGIFALNDGFGQTLKRLELIPNTDPPRVKIIPENPRHTVYEELLSEVRIIGRYVCRLTMD